jgi:type III pantothenate kinase
MTKSANHNLVIDVGNTLSKVAVFDGDSIVNLSKVEKLTTVELSQTFDRFSIKRAIISAVGSMPDECISFIEAKTSVIHFTSQTPVPIANCYKTPQTLGADRLALAVAANYLYPNQNVLAIDSGSAITYELVTSSGEYLGGAISPGINMRFRALNEFTAKLPLLKIDKNHPYIGDDTASSILSGVLNGIVNEVDGYIDAIRLQYSPLNVVFTGGDSFFFDKKLKNSIFVHPNLVLIGLNRILNYNE